MKKKLLAIVLSVVMVASLLVPMLAVSADNGPSITFSLANIRKTTRTGLDDVVYDVIGIDVNVSENTDYFFASNFLVLSEDNLTPYYTEKVENRRTITDWGDKGTFASEYAAFSYTVKTNGTEVVATGKTGIQVLVDSTVGDTGIETASGYLGTYYFIAPEAPGTYTFTIQIIKAVNDGYNEETGANDNVLTYDVTLNPGTIAYTVECTNHVEVKDTENSVAAKCGEAGKDVFKCSICGKKLREVDLDALEHDWDEGTPATNVACGSTADVTYACKREDCNETKTETGAVVEHHFVRDEANDVPAKCGVPGATAYKCDRANCPGGADSVKTVPTAALEHKYEKDEAQSTAPRCEVPGEDVLVCENANCPDSIKRVPVAALVHDWDEGTPVGNVVCGQTADIIYHCKNANCPNPERTETGAVVEHNLVRDEANDVAPKCGVPGSKAYKCDRDGCPGGADSVKTEPVAALEHNYEKDDAQSTAPRCEVPGEDVLVCENANCPDSIKRVPVAALEHDWELDEDACVAPKCGVEGADVYVCKNADCPEGTKSVPVDALEHDYNYDYYADMEIIEAPTADKAGKAKVPCRNGCGEYKEVELAKLATKVEVSSGSISSTEAILPEDIDISVDEDNATFKDGKVEVPFVFSSNIYAQQNKDLEGAVEYVLDISEAKKEYTNFRVYKVNADNTRTLVSIVEGDELIVTADLKDNLVIAYDEIVEEKEEEKSPATGDTMNVAVLAVLVFASAAALVLIGKKRFAL